MAIRTEKIEKTLYKFLVLIPEKCWVDQEADAERQTKPEKDMNAHARTPVTDYAAPLALFKGLLPHT